MENKSFKSLVGELKVLCIGSHREEALFDLCQKLADYVDDQADMIGDLKKELQILRSYYDDYENFTKYLGVENAITERKK